MTHIPVLLTETLMYLNPQSSGRYVDGTAGGGGHLRRILEAVKPKGQVLGLDRDAQVISRLQTELPPTERLVYHHASYRELPAVLADLGWENINGVLLDLGLSSIQLSAADRGFSFQEKGPLDLRFDQMNGESAAEWLAHISSSNLTEVLGRYGELARPRALAEKILAFGQSHPIETTKDLVEASGLVHPRRLAQLFQAMRIAVNDELRQLEEGLPAIWNCLAPGGRLVVMSFHSGEDRIVKHQFQAWAKASQGTVLTKRPVMAGDDERRTNPRARSSKLRAIEKL